MTSDQLEPKVAFEVQCIDQEVTRRKFNEELQNYYKVKREYARQGCILLDAEFPNMYFAFAVPHLTPAPIAFAVRINFENYDLWPLSVKFIHPLTYDPLQKKQLLTLFPKKIRKADGTIEVQELIQADLDDVPFFCIPGIREYHQHLVHTGDSWLLYRGKKQDGTLCFIIEKLIEFGTTSLRSYLVQLNIPVNLAIPQMRLQPDINSMPG